MKQGGETMIAKPKPIQMFPSLSMLSTTNLIQLMLLKQQKLQLSQDTSGFRERGHSFDDLAKIQEPYNPSKFLGSPSLSGIGVGEGLLGA